MNKAKEKFDDKNMDLLRAYLTKNKKNVMLLLGIRHDKIMVVRIFIV